jgi:hypothetical protein
MSDLDGYEVRLRDEEFDRWASVAIDGARLHLAPWTVVRREVLAAAAALQRWRDGVFGVGDWAKPKGRYRKLRPITAGNRRERWAMLDGLKGKFSWDDLVRE